MAKHKKGMARGGVFLFRHGHSLANEQGRIVSDIRHGEQAYGLTEKGEQQVRASMETFRRGPGYASKGIIYTSPFLRTKQSAGIAREILGYSVIHIRTCLRERCFGTFELTSDRHYPDVWAEDEKDASHRRWGVESVDHVWGRLQPLLQEIGQVRADIAVLLVTHGDVASILQCGVQGSDLRRHRSVHTLQTGQVVRAAL